MIHNKTWACIRPGGEGCDGNHMTDIAKAALEYAIGQEYAQISPGSAFMAGAEWAIKNLNPDQVVLNDIYDRLWDLVSDAGSLASKAAEVGEKMKPLVSREKFR